MTRKMLALLLCLILSLGLTLPATAETTTPEYTLVTLSSGVVMPAPADHIVLTLGMSDEDIASLGLNLTASYVDQLLTAQGMQADVIAPDFSYEYLLGVTPYAFTDFADFTDEELMSVLPTLEQQLSTMGVTIQNCEIARWEGNAYFVMEQHQDYQGVVCERLHAYTVKDNYGVNVILMVYAGAPTETHATLLGTVIGGLQLPQ